MKIKHIVITRLAVNWTKHKNFKQDWGIWVDESIGYMDQLCRPSLKNQSNQNFTLLSLVDESVINFGNVLPNEKILKIKSNGGDYPKKDILKQIDNYVKNISNEYDAIITTRLDRDDCLHKDFIEIVQTKLKGCVKNTYVDIKNSITYDIVNDIVHDSPKYNSMVSPFVSTFEVITNNSIQCVSMKYDHTDVNKYLSGSKMNELAVIQVITGKNMLNKMYGKPTKILKKDYGIE